MSEEKKMTNAELSQLVEEERNKREELVDNLLTLLERVEKLESVVEGVSKTLMSIDAATEDAQDREWMRRVLEKYHGAEKPGIAEGVYPKDAPKTA